MPNRLPRNTRSPRNRNQGLTEKEQDRLSKTIAVGVYEPLDRHSTPNLSATQVLEIAELWPRSVFHGRSERQQEIGRIGTLLTAASWMAAHNNTDALDIFSQAGRDLSVLRSATQEPDSPLPKKARRITPQQRPHYRRILSELAQSSLEHQIYQLDIMQLYAGSFVDDRQPETEIAIASVTVSRIEKLIKKHTEMYDLISVNDSANRAKLRKKDLTESERVKVEASIARSKKVAIDALRGVSGTISEILPIVACLYVKRDPGERFRAIPTPSVMDYVRASVDELPPYDLIMYDPRSPRTAVPLQIKNEPNCLFHHTVAPINPDWIIRGLDHEGRQSTILRMAQAIVDDYHHHVGEGLPPSITATRIGNFILEQLARPRR